MRLGPYPEVGQADAREEALEARRLVKKGIDPIAERGPAKITTFKEAAKALIGPNGLKHE